MPAVACPSTPTDLAHNQCSRLEVWCDDPSVHDPAASIGNRSSVPDRAYDRILADAPNG